MNDTRQIQSRVLINEHIFTTQDFRVRFCKIKAEKRMIEVLGPNASAINTLFLLFYRGRAVLPTFQEIKMIEVQLLLKNAFFVGDRFPCNCNSR